MYVLATYLQLVLSIIQECFFFAIFIFARPTTLLHILISATPISFILCFLVYCWFLMVNFSELLYIIEPCIITVHFCKSATNDLSFSFNGAIYLHPILGGAEAKEEITNRL